jgi:SH3-like domain-containing protein
MAHLGARYGLVMVKPPPIFAAIVLSALPLSPATAASDVPYWASIRASEVNMRVGPGEDYRIKWIYRRQLLPMKVVRTMEGWRLVQDPDGAQGWMRARFLSRERGAYVRGNGPADMREQGAEGARLLWRIAPGNVGRLLDECKKGWCGLDVGGRVGFVRQDRLWGAGEP